MGSNYDMPMSDIRRRINERKKRLLGHNTTPLKPEPRLEPRNGRHRDEKGRFSAEPKKKEEKKRSILDTIANVSHSLKKKIGIDYSADIRKKLQGLYDLIQDRALYIAPEKNIQFGLADEIGMRLLDVSFEFIGERNECAHEGAQLHGLSRVEFKSYKGLIAGHELRIGSWLSTGEIQHSRSGAVAKSKVLHYLR